LVYSYDNIPRSMATKRIVAVAPKQNSRARTTPDFVRISKRGQKGATGADSRLFFEGKSLPACR
jgi:hypothetical protein